MPNTVLGGVALPPDLRWTDEYEWAVVKVKRDRSLSGSQILQAATAIAGRPVTLSSGDRSAWLSRVQLDALATLRDVPYLTPMPLVLPDARTFSVVFDLTGDAPISAVAIRPGKFVEPGDWFRVTLKLFTV